MPKFATPTLTLTWNQDPGPILDAGEAAGRVLADANIPFKVTVELEWADGVSNEDSIAAAREELRFAQPPKRVKVSLYADERSGSDGAWLVVDRTSLLAWAKGTDFALTQRIFDAMSEQASRAAVPTTGKSPPESAQTPSQNPQPTAETIQPPIDASSAEAAPRSNRPSVVEPANVMVVHGRDEEARRARFDFLRALHLKPLEWSNAVRLTGSGAPYVGQILEAAFGSAQAVVALFTPDDEARLQPSLFKPDDADYERDLTPQARPNVLFEAGMAFGTHPDRAILVELGALRPFSDVFGRHVIRLDGTQTPLRELAQRLRSAGCPVDDSGTDWREPGRFPSR